MQLFTARDGHTNVSKSNSSTRAQPKYALQCGEATASSKGALSHLKSVINLWPQKCVLRQKSRWQKKESQRYVRYKIGSWRRHHLYKILIQVYRTQDDLSVETWKVPPQTKIQINVRRIMACYNTLLTYFKRKKQNIEAMKATWSNRCNFQ